ncbi:ArsR/SmtB family transcription factor [Streptomyces antarcticus]|uniref:ArsR/SmtB family transcription factor n=1 Tax=Streptomyces antarcticus TaxID=2996458 RepID=UPI00226D8EA2|nr:MULTISPECIES: winged helix-turn-helix domain-containing protein [unclassified Streptomyces]MCY0941364.1 winged helix-turn-helix domain-containing protein [Streptomyces sp. H34-AA3]MCZ4086076.1 winged helix-turn-helix domain-containing protein [Streptomyces sp. H34-S5]
MQRIHFTASDLARTRLQSTLGPLAEGVLALGALSGPGQTEHARWRAEVRRRLGPPVGSGPPPPRTGPRSAAHRPEDLLFLLERPAPAGADAPSAPPHLDAARRALDMWRIGVAPYWERIRERMEAECGARGQIVLTGGVELLLLTLHPKVVWRGLVLEVHDGPDRDIHLDGRGLLLCPSVFLLGSGVRVLTSERETGMAALVFAVAVADTLTADGWGGAPEGGSQALAALVGQTRAAALRSLTAACTTGQLAARLGISSAGASQHAAILRKSGLITSRRVRSHVLHTVTPLGMALLGGRLRDAHEAADPVQRPAAHAVL